MFVVAVVFQNDLVCLPLKLARSLGNINQVVLCNRVTSFLQFVDPTTLQGCSKIIVHTIGKIGKSKLHFICNLALVLIVSVEIPFLK